MKITRWLGTVAPEMKVGEKRLGAKLLLLAFIARICVTGRGTMRYDTVNYQLGHHR